MQRDIALRYVQEVIQAYLEKAPEDYTLDMSLRSLGADSLDTVKLVIDLEEKIDKEIKAELVETLLTVNDVVTMLETNF